jgi:hypothetical protein
MATSEARRTLTGRFRDEGGVRVYEVREERTLEVRVPLARVKGKPADDQRQEVSDHGKLAGWK